MSATPFPDAPARIWLNVCSEGDCGESFRDHSEVTWCEDKVHDTDIAYVRASTTQQPVVVINDPETLATQIGFAMRLADAPLSEAQFVTLCAYLKVRSEPDE